jgi:hypothetical protein
MTRSGDLDRLEERLRGGHVAVLAEHHVDQRARGLLSLDDRF